MSGPLLIWGAGAIGGTIGAALIRAGEDVLFVDSAADHVAAINAAGLEITGPVDAHRVAARAVTPENLAGPFDRVILAVKAHNTVDVLDGLARHLAPGGDIVSAQNGLNEHVLAGRFGRENVIGCFVNFGADYIEPGVVLYGGRGAVVVGEINGSVTARIEEVHRLFGKFDRDAVLTRNIWGYLWAKMIYGTLLFATALTNDSIADVLAMKRYRPMLTRLAHEVVAVARAEGVSLEAFNGFDPAAFVPEASWVETERSFDEMVAHNRKSAKSHSGIWRDLAVRKRRTEVDAQPGAVVAVGQRHGVATPLTARIVEIIHDIEEGRSALDLAHLENLDKLEPAGAAS